MRGMIALSKTAKDTISLRPTRSALLYAGSLCMAFAWVFLTFSNGALRGGTLGTDMFPSSFAFCIAYLLIALVSSKIARKQTALRTFGISSLCLFACSILLAVPGLGLSATADDVLFVLASIFVALMTMIQFFSIGRLPREQALLASCIGFGAGAFFPAFLIVLGQPALSYACAVLPLAAFGFQAVAMKGEKPYRRAKGEKDGQLTLPPLPWREDPETRKLFGLFALLCVSVLFFGIAHDNARIGYLHVFAQSQGNLPDAASWAYPLLYSATVVLGVGVMTAATLLRNREEALLSCYRFVALATVCIQLFPLFPLDQTVHATVFLPVHMGIYRCALFLFWLAAMALSTNNEASGIRSFAIMSSVQYFGQMLGFVLWMRAYSSIEQFYYPLMFASTMLVLISYLGIFNETRIRQFVRMTNPEGSGRFSQCCQAIADRYKLSKREHEVMALLAKGRNLDYIHTKLCISKSTVSMHRQHIYQKLDIHSQQELIDLVDRTI